MDSRSDHFATLFETWCRPRGLRALAAAVVLLGLAGAVALAVFLTGGTGFAWLHLMYVPILLAGAVFRVPGGVLAALAGGLLLGPLMPLDAAAGISQKTGNWVFRTLFFVIVGGLGGFLSSLFQAQIARIKLRDCTDPESGLPNLLALRERLSAVFDSREARGNEALLAILDFTNVREIFDTVGYRSARALLPQVVARFGAPAAGMSLYRMAPERFAILAEGTAPQDFNRHLEELLKGFRDPFDVADVPMALDGQLGIAPAGLAAGPDEMIQKASVAAHVAGTRGTLLETYRAENDASCLETLALLGSLNAAIRNRELTLYFQPKVRIDDNRVVGAEALIRWHHPVEGLVPPGRYIAAAEKTWLVNPLTFYAVEATLDQLKEMAREGLGLRLAVNLTARNLQNEWFMQRVVERVEAADVDASHLEIEITERSLLVDPETAVQFLLRLKALGAAIAIDDFGTGYSTLGLVRKLPVDSIKIDQSYIRNLLTSDFSRAVVRRTIQTAQDLGITVVCEGVESEAIFNKLRQIGCDIAQGYYISPPLAAEAFAAWLRKSPWGGPEEGA